MELTATYDDAGRVCSYRIETTEHSVKVTPRVSDGRYWMDAEQTIRLIATLVPQASRKGPAQRDTTNLDVGEQMVVESDDAVQITRLQRSRP